MTSIGSGKIMLLAIFMVFLCGCTAVNPSSIVITTEAPTPTVTATPTKPPVTPNILPTIITPNLTAVPTAIPTASPVPTRAPRLREPTPTPVPTMNLTQPYLKYENLDFKVEYPSNWTIDVTSIPAVHTPLNRQDEFKDDSRKVVFSGGNSSIYFEVITSDFIVPGGATLKANVYSVYDTVSARFPDVGSSAISNYAVRYTALYQTPMIQFDVTIPVYSTFYPLAYTERDFVSYNHFYTMRFITPGNPEDYKEIRKHLFDTIQAEEIVRV